MIRPSGETQGSPSPADVAAALAEFTDGHDLPALVRGYQDADFADSPAEIENVMLTAADVDHQEFNDQFKQEIKALADNVTVYVSSNDRALLVSRVINRGRRLGESTLDPGNPSQEEQVARLTELLEPDDDGLVWWTSRRWELAGNWPKRHSTAAQSRSTRT